MAEADTQSDSPIEQAKALVERQEKANADHKALLDREERLRANAIIAGKADAGSAPKPKVEIDPVTYAKAILSNKIPEQ